MINEFFARKLQMFDVLLYFLKNKVDDLSKNQFNELLSVLL